VGVSEVEEMDIDSEQLPVYRTTNRTWRPGSYIAPEHQYLVQEVYDPNRRYRMDEEVAFAVKHRRHEYRIAQVNWGTGGMEEAELRNSTLGLTHGIDRRPSQEPHDTVRQLYTQCSRVPGEVMGPEDAELLRSHRPATSMHFEGDTVGVPFIWAGGQQGFRYAKVCAKDEETTGYSTGLYQLDGGEHNPGMLRPRDAFYAMDRQSPTRKGLQSEDIQEVPGRNGAPTQEEWSNHPEPTPAGGRKPADKEWTQEPESQDPAGCDNGLTEVARTLLNAATAQELDPQSTCWKSISSATLESGGTQMPANAKELHERTDAEDGVEAATSREESPTEETRKHSQFFYEQSRPGPQDEGLRIFLSKDWQQETCCDIPLRLVLEDGTQINGIFERSQVTVKEGSGTLDINLGRIMRESAVEHLLQLLPLTQCGNKILQCCQYITFREIQPQSVGGVIFFRMVPHTASDEGGWIIEGIGVRAELRGKGIGTALVRQTIATVLRECVQAGSPRTYISAEQHARWWLARQGFVRADPKWNLNRRKGTFAMVWRPTQRELCESYTTAEIQWGWQPRPIANPSNWCHVISVLQLLLATGEFTDRMRAATWTRYGVGDTILEIMQLQRGSDKKRGYEVGSPLYVGQLIMRLWSSLTRILPRQIRTDAAREEERDVDETLEAIMQALQAEQASLNPAEAALQLPFGQDVWGTQLTWTEKCTQCGTTRTSPCRQWANYVTVDANEGAGDLSRRLDRPQSDTAESNNFDACACRARILRTPLIDGTSRIVIVKIARADCQNPGMRVGPRIPCPLHMIINTSQGDRQLELRGLIVHGCLQGKAHEGTPGRSGMIITQGHFVTILNEQARSGKALALVLDDGKPPRSIRHDEPHCPINMLDKTHRYVESLALYVDVNPIYPNWYTRSPLQLLRHSLTTLGISVAETLECTLERGVHQDMTLLPSSLTEPVKWNCPEYTPGQGTLTETIHRRALEMLLMEPVNQPLKHRVTCDRVSQRLTQQTERDAVASLLSGVTQQSAVVWNQPRLLVLPPGHAERPMLSPLPTIVCSLGSKGGGQMNNYEAGTTLLLLSCADLRELDIESGKGNSFLDFSHLLRQIRRRGKVNGSVIRCRVITVDAFYPIATWPGDWICCVIGDPHNGQEGRDILAVTAWKPTDATNLQRALRNLDGLQTDERACQSLQELGFGETAMGAAKEWLTAGEDGPPITDL